jgi:hypothetical protein
VWFSLSIIILVEVSSCLFNSIILTPGICFRHKVLFLNLISLFTFISRIFLSSIRLGRFFRVSCENGFSSSQDQVQIRPAE